MAPIKEVNDAVYKIIGSCMEVHKILGPGLPLEFYKHALEIEFPGRELIFETDKEVEVVFKDKLIGRMQVDFVVNGSVIIMVRSMENLRDIEIQQVLRAMRLLSLGMGILVNFGNVKIQYKRVLPSRGQKESRKDPLRSMGYREMGRTREENPLT